MVGAIAFSGKAIIVKLAYRSGVDAITLIMYRMLFALPIFALMAYWAGRGKPALTRQDRWGIAGLGLTGYYLASYLDFAGLTYISASLERLIQYLTPTLVLLLGWLLYRRGDGADPVAAAAAQQLFFRQARGLRRGRARARRDIQPAARVVCAGGAGCAMGLVARLRAADRHCVRALLPLTQVISALAAVAGFYLLSRSIDALQIMAANPLSGDLSLGQKLVNFVVDAIAFLLPGLDRMTQTGWLIYSAPSAAEIMGVLAQTAVYALLLCAAALFDLQRKNF